MCNRYTIVVYGMLGICLWYARDSIVYGMLGTCAWYARNCFVFGMLGVSCMLC